MKNSDSENSIPQTAPFDHTTHPEYEEGRAEYGISGNKKMKCPNSPYDGGKKTTWLVGWLDARTEDVLKRD